ncbi:hypothetical protein BJ166DRAFT_630461 [Pestalotiopsis sp. NC0098]|nr:hypothetical protein BJ166DRAFT_630461 [Pestalotiopsis sp. NC0098]
MLFTIDHIELWRWRQKLHLRVFPGKLESDGLESVEKRPLWGRHWSDRGNIPHEPVSEEGYIFADVLAKPWAADVIQCMFGSGSVPRFHSTDTAFRAGGRQPLHIDADSNFPGIPFGYRVNIDLVDTSIENGSTEVWLGSHRCRMSLAMQSSLPKSSLVIRDFKLWRDGMPNKTDDPRVMLALIQFPHSYRSDLKTRLPMDMIICKVYTVTLLLFS